MATNSGPLPASVLVRLRLEFSRYFPTALSTCTLSAIHRLTFTLSSVEQGPQLSFCVNIKSAPNRNMSILDRSIRSTLSSCDEALEEHSDHEDLHRVCSRDTLDDSDDLLAVNHPICYSTENLISMSSSIRLPTVDLSEVEEEEENDEIGRVSRERMMSYEVNNYSDSEDDDDVYEPEWKIYGEFKDGVLEDQRRDDFLPVGSSAVWMQEEGEQQQQRNGSEEKRLGRKRHYRLGQMSSDLENLVKQLEVIPAKMRRMDNSEGGGC